jgi:parallel beta-helix repeat protein
MKGMIKNQKYLLKVLFIIWLLLFLTACGGVTPGTDPPTIHSFASSSTSITEGESVTLSWNVTGADSVAINQGVGTVSAPSGSISISPASTITYTLTVTNSAGSSTAVVTVTVSSGSTYVISATAGEGGHLDLEGDVLISQGGSHIFTITPDDYYQIDDVVVDGLSVGPVSTYTFQDVQQNHTIQATFVLTVSIYNNDSKIGYETIQAAINAAASGQTVIVYPGTYYENIVFNNKNITVRTADSSKASFIILKFTIIDGAGSGSVVTFTGGDTSTLEGFTIRNGDATDTGGGVDIINSSPTIIGNTITGNKAVVHGGGIFMYNSSPTIKNNIISNNQSAAYGGGITVEYSSPTIMGNTITDNTANGGGGIYAHSSFPTIKSNTITGNKAYSVGGGILSQISSLLPVTVRPTGWGTVTKNIPTSALNDPAAGEEYVIAENIFLGNKHGTPLGYSEGAHVYFL